MSWIGYAILQVTPKRHPPIFFQIFRIHIFNHFIKNPQTTIALTFLNHIISDIGGVITHNVNRTIKPRTVFAVESFKKICRVNNSYGHGNESDKKLRYKKVLYLRQHKSVLDYKQKISPFLRKRLLFCCLLYATALDTLLFSIMDLVGKYRLENHILSIRMEHHCNWWDPKGSKYKGIFHHITWGSTKISYI